MAYNLARFDQGKFFAFKKKHVADLAILRRFLIGDDAEVQEISDAWLIRTEIEIFPPATLEQIQYLEEQFQVTIPIQYRDFLLTANGVDLFILKQKNGHIVTQCSILSHKQVVETYFGLREIARIMLDDPQIENLFYLPVADITDGVFIGLSTHPESFGEIFELYNDSGYIPYTPENQAHRHYKKIYKNFKQWLELVLDTHGAEGLRR